MRKPAFCIYENKDADQLRGNLCAFVFATPIVKSFYFLNPKFQASSYLLWLYSPVCVGPGQKPRRPVFSERGSYEISLVFFQAFEEQEHSRLMSTGASTALPKGNREMQKNLSQNSTQTNIEKTENLHLM